MLPRSFLSASSLKEMTKAPGPKSEQIPTKNPTKRTKRQRPNDDKAVNDPMDTGSDSVSDTSSDSDGDMSTLFENYSLAYLQSDIGALQTEIQHQQAKQKKYMRKIHSLDKTIRKNNKKLGHLTRLLITQQQQQQQQLPLPSTHLTKNTLMGSLALTTTKSERGKSTADDQDAPLFQTTSRLNTHPRFGPTPATAPSPNSKIITAAKPSSINRSTPDAAPRDHIPASRSSDLAFMDTLDVLTKRRITTTKNGLDRKVRVLSVNDHEKVTNTHMKNIMVSSTLDGELQFWSTRDNKRIDKLGASVLFQDTWVDDLCWASPTTLTLIPASRDGLPNDKSVILLDMKSVDGNSIKGDIQTLTKLPHDKGFDVITSADFGNYSSALKENVSFVTAGGDKTIHLWKLSRDASDDSFDEELSRLDIRHTAKIQVLCADNVTRLLYSGGANQKFDAFDMELGSSAYSFSTDGRINSITLSKANPNYTLLGLSKTERQFCIYDKRCRAANGLRLQFGSTESENMPRYAQPDWHSNGYTVVYGSRGGPKLNFWDLRYIGVEKGPSYTITIDEGNAGNKTHKVMKAVFLPNSNKIAAVTASRSLFWIDSSFSTNCKPARMYSA